MFCLFGRCPDLIGDPICESAEGCAAALHNRSEFHWRLVNFGVAVELGYVGVLCESSFEEVGCVCVVVLCFKDVDHVFDCVDDVLSFGDGCVESELSVRCLVEELFVEYSLDVVLFVHCD